MTHEWNLDGSRAPTNVRGQHDAAADRRQRDVPTSWRSELVQAQARRERVVRQRYVERARADGEHATLLRVSRAERRPRDRVRWRIQQRRLGDESVRVVRSRG